MSESPKNDKVSFYKREFQEKEKAGYYDHDSPIDETLLEYIEQNGLDDTLFFECIRESPRYLSCEPFQKKILKWQEILFGGPKGGGKTKGKGSEAFKAKENLKKIGFCLAYEGSGRRKDDRLETGIFYEYIMLLEQLESVLTHINTLKSQANKRLSFRELCPRYSKFSDLIPDEKLHPVGFSKKILSKKYNQSIRSIDCIVKDQIISLAKTASRFPSRLNDPNRSIRVLVKYHPRLFKSSSAKTKN